MSVLLTKTNSMNAHEFRIGNYIVVDGAIALILAVDSDGTEAVVETLTTKDNRIKTKISKIKPVPLTPQLLHENCQFDKSGKYNIGLDDYLYFLEFKEGYISLLDRKGQVMIRFMDIRNLHQLQNLVYALKGIEMDICEFPHLTE